MPALLVLALCACRADKRAKSGSESAEPNLLTRPFATRAMPEEAEHLDEAEHETAQRQAERVQMVARQLGARDVDDPRVLEAMRDVPRHRFMPEEVRHLAYVDSPVPIGYQQTISQPYIVAKMTELADVGKNSKVLEIGTGSGYQAAVLGELADQVYSIEIVEPLATSAKQTLRELGYQNVHVRHGDGYQGWPSRAPFDAIVVTAAPPKIPEPLKQQLAVGGKLVIPVGEDLQHLEVHTRTEGGLKRQTVFPVRFVPMTGQAQEAKQ